jgi:hypothetical protein
MRRQKFIIRNDDVNADTTLEDIKWFSELCDRYGFKIIQCITPLGVCQKVDIEMDNNTIRNLSDNNFFDNKEVAEYLKGRNDLIGVHGLWHTHEPSEAEIEEAKEILTNGGLKPTYFVTPFNEGDYPKEICGLQVSAKTQRLEDYLDGGIPTDEIVYLHSWRFGKWYDKNKLEICLARIMM